MKKRLLILTDSPVLLAVLLANFVSVPTIAMIHETGCYPRDGSLPCGGAPGKCSINRDGTQGGFIAETAHVEKSPVNHFQGMYYPFADFNPAPKNIPYIGLFAQVCD